MRCPQMMIRIHKNGTHLISHVITYGELPSLFLDGSHEPLKGDLRFQVDERAGIRIP
jgi:hypothetical protein